MVDINVAGNVEGSIVVGDHNFVVNNNHGTIVHQAALPTQRRSASPAPPRKPIGFVGRKFELKQLDEWINSCTPVIVHGLDGIGKTSLVKQAANSDSAKSQPDGVVFLEGLDEAGKLLEFSDLIQRLFDSLFESQPRLKVDLTSARTYLSNTKPLVLLNSISLQVDDLEKLPDLFPNAPILIATEGFDSPENYETIALGPLAQNDSLDLLADRTKAEDRENLAQIATLLENVPAALIVVANAINKKGLKLDEALARLQSYTPIEKDKAKAALDRAFALIVSTLTEEEREMLLQTAAAPGLSTERKWLESVCGGSSVSEKLESLQLLQANSPRLRLMPGLRPFLLRGQDISKERERLLSYLLAELQTRWNDFEFIKDELGNLLGLLAWAAAQGQWMHVATLGRAIDPYLTLRGLWGAWRKNLGEIQRAADSMQNLALQGWVLHQLGTYEIGMGNVAAARDLLQQAVKIRTQLGDKIGAAYSQHNLQIIAPVVPPTAHTTNWMPWALGGLAVVAIAAFLIFGKPPNRPAAPTTEPIVVAASEVPLVASPSSTPTATSTLIERPSPSPTVTLTFTPSPTGTPTVTPTYAILSNILVNDLAKDVHAPCFYGPGTMYLTKGTNRIPGNKVDVLGRIETDTGIWVNTQFSLPRTDASDPCWMNAKYLDITPEQLRSVKPIDPANPEEYKLPIAYDSIETLQNPNITRVSRTGDEVKVEWEFYDVGKGQYPNHNEKFYRYLMEAWLCQAGKIVFSPSGWGGPTDTAGVTVYAQLTDEAGCTEPSHARLYLAWAHGYAGPSEIEPWPQNGIAPSPTP